jgi:aspartate kinase
LTGIHTLGELTDRSLDAIASIGERLSSYLIYLCAQSVGINVTYIDAADVIKTDSRFTQAKPDIAAITEKAVVLKQASKNESIPVMGGFYGSDPNGVTTTLGRGGSDFTASLVGLAVGADTIGIYTDVSGMYTSDPRFIKNTQSIPNISFGEAAELAYFGAKVLHPATIQPAVERNIPVLVKNTFEPEHPGTTIQLDAPYSGKIRAIAFKKSIQVITVHSTSMLLAHGFIARVFTVFEQHQVSVDLVSTSEVSISITVDSPKNTDAVVEDLKKFAQVSVRSDQALICLVGQDLIDAKGLMKRAFTALEDIPVHMISQGSSDLNMSIVIDNDDVIRAVQVLHDTFITP